MSDRFRWRNAVASGGVWGVIVMLVITLNQPVGGLGLADWGPFMAWLTVIWSLTGVIWACGVKLAEASARPRLWLSSTIAAALCISVLGSLISWPLEEAATQVLSVLLNHVAEPADDTSTAGLVHLLNHVPLDGQIAYNLWTNLTYGGLYTVGYFATRRTQRLRRRLSELSTSRSDAEAALPEARLGAVRGQVQPAMLLEALDALRLAYDHSPAAGEALFDRIIAFLRAAMPGLRSGASTLSAELAVVTRYRELSEALSTERRLWRLELAEPPAELAFPPLRLLPALDRVSRALPADARMALTTVPFADAFVVRVAVDALQPLTPATLHRLRAGLRRDLGARLAPLGGSPEGVICEIRMPTAA